MNAPQTLLDVLLRIDGIRHPVIALGALVFPFIFVERVVLKRDFLRALVPLAATLTIFFLLFYMTPVMSLGNVKRPMAYDFRQFAFLSIPVAFLFVCERGRPRDSLLRTALVLLAALSLNQFILVKSGAMTGNGETDKTSDARVRDVLDDNFGRISDLTDKEKYYPPGKLDSNCELWQDVRNAGGDWPDRLLSNKVIVENATPAWHSFFTDLYWYQRRPVALCWAGGLAKRSWFYLEDETIEQGRKRWEIMLDERFRLGRPEEMESQHLTTEPVDVVPLFVPVRPPGGPPIPPGPPPAPPKDATE